jgi:hypothetical protein
LEQRELVGRKDKSNVREEEEEEEDGVWNPMEEEGRGQKRVVELGVGLVVEFGRNENCGMRKDFGMKENFGQLCKGQWDVPLCIFHKLLVLGIVWKSVLA